jgi:hypothetical protein
MEVTDLGWDLEVFFAAIGWIRYIACGDSVGGSE